MNDLSRQICETIKTFVRQLMAKRKNNSDIEYENFKTNYWKAFSMSLSDE